jgi:hypothetical protein
MPDGKLAFHKGGRRSGKTGAQRARDERELYVLARAKGASADEAKRSAKRATRPARIALVVEAATLRREGWAHEAIAGLKKFDRYADERSVWKALKDDRAVGT